MVLTWDLGASRREDNPISNSRREAAGGVDLRGRICGQVLGQNPKKLPEDAEIQTGDNSK